MEKFLKVLTIILTVIFVTLVIISGGLMIYVGYLVFHTWGLIGLLCFIWFIVVITS